jgi:Na+/H+ antiporter NhaD/arsenite permease-like protein
LAAILIFAITYLVLAIGRLPGFRIDRTGAAIIGASFMVGVNVLTLDDAYLAINFDTIILLFGMMIVVANLQLSGFFSLVAERAVEHAHRPVLILVAIVAVAGVFSAFFVHDTMCLMLTPLALEIAGLLGRNRGQTSRAHGSQAMDLKRYLLTRTSSGWLAGCTSIIPSS